MWSNYMGIYYHSLNKLTRFCKLLFSIATHKLRVL
jgi:hypothetical protein